MPICADFLSRSEMFTTCSNFISQLISHGIRPLRPKPSFRILINKTGHFRRISFDFNLFRLGKNIILFRVNLWVNDEFSSLTPGGFRSPWSCLIFLPHERKKTRRFSYWWSVMTDSPQGDRQLTILFNLILNNNRTVSDDNRVCFCKHLSGLIPGGRPLSGKCTGVSRKYPNDVLWHYDQVELNFTSLQTVDFTCKGCISKHLRFLISFFFLVLRAKVKFLYTSFHRKSWIKTKKI